LPDKDDGGKAMTAITTNTGVDRLRIEHVACAESAVGFLSRKLRTAWNRWVFLRAAREVAQVLETGDRDALVRAAPGWRARLKRFRAPSNAVMMQALEGLRIVPAAETKVDAFWIESESFAPGGVLVYVPGGSFVGSVTPRLKALVARVAKAAGVRAFIVEYRLAPEHPCPAAVDDVARAVRELIAAGQPADRVVVLADSAGAAVALAAVQRLRAQDIALAGLCLFSPWTDLALTGLSHVTRGIDRQSDTRMEYPALCAHLYLQGRSPFDPVASPVYGDLSGLPRMLVHTSRTDTLHDDARTLAERAFRAGTDVTLRIWPHGEHAFEQGFNGQSERAIADAGAFIRARLNG
jgi:acetyl esterase/lipase